MSEEPLQRIIVRRVCLQCQIAYSSLGDCPLCAARAKVAELREENERLRDDVRNFGDYEGAHHNAIQERDAARAEVERLREALTQIAELAARPCVVAIARAALGGEEET